MYPSNSALNSFLKKQQPLVLFLVGKILFTPKRRHLAGVFCHR
jgi:hypothetical protein